jgi:thymidylate synthase
MNKLDLDYQNLLKDILDNGVKKDDRTGTGTISVFGRHIRHKMSEGFPLLTTKKMPFRLVATELLWFLRGDTNIKFLVDNNCHIWDGDAYRNYEILMMGNPPERILGKDEFIQKIKEDVKIEHSPFTFAERWGDLGPIYGSQWRSWGYDSDKWREEYKNLRFGSKEEIEHLGKKGIDQIQNLINDLKTNPDSRRLMVNAWNVGELDHMVLPPCHYGFQVYTRELSERERWDLYTTICIKLNTSIKESANKETMESYYTKYNIPKRAISLMWNQRSVDTPLGLPFNIASYGLLLEIVAKAVNMIPDELIGNLGDCHVYVDQVDGVKEQITRHSFTLPTLNINTEWWPTESGECGVGPIDAEAVFNGFVNDNFCKCLLEEDLQLNNYQSHPTIKFPLSN